MRAALQLLDKGENATAVASGPSSKHVSDGGSNRSILKFGILKKASGNKLAHGVWKPKYVEIRHGDFIYEDDASSWGEIGKKKTISLVADRCRCRPVKKKSDHTVFELTEYGGIRRLWRANSAEERDSWVHSINAAMVGSAGDFEGDDAGVVFSPSPGKYSPRTPKGATSFTGLHRSSGKQVSLENTLFTPYTEGIDRFIQTRECVYQSTSAEQYRRLLNSFATSHKPFVVPVGFAKNYGKRAELRRASTHIISNQTSQVWKDMCRDVIFINGVRFTGIESIICGLVRTLVDCADRIRLLQVQRQQMEVASRADVEVSQFKRGASLRDSILGLTGMGDSSLGLVYHEDCCPLFDLNEGQILACAKEILFSCNRTQSGGDTYDSVNSMICHDTYAVLTPFDTEAEPMEIRIDVIQRENTLGVVHNAWIDKTTAPGSADAKVRSIGGHSSSIGVLSDNEMPPKSKNSNILSPFKRMGSTRKVKKKDKRTSDPGIATPYYGTATPPTPVNRRHNDHLHEGTPDEARKNHVRSETNSTASSVPTPRQPYFIHDYDEATSDEELQHSKKTSEWHNPASTTHDFSQPLGVGDEEKQKSTNLPPPTLTNLYRDRWGNSVSSFPDESSLGSSTAGATSVSSSDNSGAIRTRVKAMFVKSKSRSAMRSDKGFHLFGDPKKRVEGSEMSEEDCNRQPQSNTTSASASSGSNIIPLLPLHAVHLNDEFGGSTKSDGDEENSKEGQDIRTTPRKIVNIEDISSGGGDDAGPGDHLEDIDSISPTLVSRTKFISNTQGASEITERPMCIRVEVRAKSKYKICSMDPQGDGDDTWASVTGIFQQLFYLKSFCNGKPSVSDKIVAIDFDSALVS